LTQIYTGKAESCSVYAVLISAITGTRVEDWSNLEIFSLDPKSAENDIREAEERGAQCGPGIFSKIFMVHRDGRTADVQYNLDDEVFVNCGDTRWAGPLEDKVHSFATLSRDYNKARSAYLEEISL
jgi:hypothetical protein